METKIKWMYDGHREAMKQAVSQTPAISNAGILLRSNYAAALYLLTGIESVWPRIEKYVSRDGIDHAGMLDEPLSYGEQLIVGLSGNLFNDRTYINFSPVDLVGYLDDDMFDLAMGGIILCRRRPTLAIFGDAPE